MGCTVDDYQLKAKALSGLSGECIPMLNQLRTMQSVDPLSIINDVLRDVDTNNVSPKSTKKDGSYRGLDRETVMRTSVGSKSRVTHMTVAT